MFTQNNKTPQGSSSQGIHYGWYVIAAGTLSIFASLGLGRFALGMMLPSMGKALHLSYSEMGLISTSNFIGYLVAVLLCGKISTRFGARRLISAGLLLSGLSMVLIGLAKSLYAIIPLYVLTGMGSAFTNVPIMALVSVWFARHKRGKAAGFIVIGSGFAIILSGKLIPFLNQVSANGWRIGWVLLGLIVVAVAAVCYTVLRDRPQDLGLMPVGEDAPVPGRTTPKAFDLPKIRPSVLYHCAAIYFLFGFTYVIYATFVVTTMVQERGFSEAAAGNFWSWVGFLSLFSGPVFGTLSDKYGRKAALGLVFTIQTMAYLLIAFNLPGLSLYLSIFCYGIVAWAIPSIMAALIGDYVGPQRAVAAFGFITFCFGIGQVSGPYLAGVLAEATGSFSSSFYLASAMTGVAIILSMALPSSTK
jgi:MFS family permease